MTIRSNNNALTGFSYLGNTYYYVKNLQNDITGILDSNYNLIATCTYDAWGNNLAIKDQDGIDVSNNEEHIANINPFRYRSYYYDKETNLYYLNSRYYNPVWGRFINADIGVADIGSSTGYNMYEYSFNNPISLEDSDGTWPKVPKWLKKTLAVTAIVVSTVAAIGALVVAAPAIISTVGVYAGAVGISTAAVAAVVNTAVVTTSVALTVNAVNRTNQIMTGENVIAEKIMGGNEELYDKVEQALFLTSYMASSYSQIYGQYPSTGRNDPSNIKEQMALNYAIDNPRLGTPINNINMTDPRMPAFMGWEKLKYPYTGEEIHSVGNKFIPFYFDFKIK